MKLSIKDPVIVQLKEERKDLISYFIENKIIISSTLILVSLLKTFVYYKLFGILIFKYLDIEGSVLLFIPDIMAYLLYLAYFIFLRKTANNSIKITVCIVSVLAIWLLFGTAPDNISLAEKIIISILIVVGSIISHLRIGSNLSVRAQIAWLIGLFVIYSISTGCIEFCKTVAGFNSEIQVYTKNTKQIRLSNFDKNNKCNMSNSLLISIDDDNAKKETSDSNSIYYIGETKDYIFIYDEKQNKTKLIKREELDHIEYTDSIRKSFIFYLSLPSLFKK